MRGLLDICSRVVKTGSDAVTALTRKVDDVAEVARVTGTSLGKAKAHSAWRANSERWGEP
jgi:hypothetical protein